jgi:two-component system, cell cycle response regulator DivK
VDDYRDALEMWALYLRSHGYEVLTSEDGLAALRVAQDETPDLVVLDLDLPSLSGTDVARRLRADPLTAKMPLIAVTGHSSDRHRSEALQAGFDTILIKPCDPPGLVREIVRLLAGI